MDSHDKFHTVSQYRHNNETRHIKQHREQLSNDRLLKIVEKKLTTTFIGDIAKIEEIFGFLWGGDKHENDMTDEEYDWFVKWKVLRNKILDSGNSQIRAIKKELSQYNIQWNRYQHRWRLKNEE